MINLPKNHNYHPKLVEVAKEFCKTIGATEITNIAILHPSEFRIMYRLPEIKDEKGNILQEEKVWYKILDLPKD